MFQRAVKRDAKLRLALCGPAGSGKTYSLLSIATELAGPGGRIAYVDTEHGSASKYADLFNFDVIEPDQFDPRDLIKTIKAAADAGYRVICIDSLSHYWMGKGGELDMVDSVAKRSQSGNSFAAWKNITPIHNELVDTIIAAQIHVMVSMRTKTEWVIEENERGKKTPRKIGLAPVMRDGIEFEFDVCGDLDQDNTLTVTKSRCPELAGKIINRPGRDMAIVLRKWLTGAPAAPAAPASAPAPRPPAAPSTPPAPAVIDDSDIPTQLGGTYQGGPNPAAERIEAARAAAAPTQPPAKPWTTFKGMLDAYAKERARVGDQLYYATLAEFGVQHSNEFKSGEVALACYAKLLTAPKQEVAA